MKAKKKTWFRKLNHSVLKKKTPLLGFTVLQVFILFVVMSGGGAAVILSRQQKPVTQNTGTTIPTYDTDTTQTKSTVSQGNTQGNLGTPKTTTNSTPKATANLPDQYGCIPQTSGYDSCVKYAKQNALTLSCDSQAKAAGDTYSATEDQAQAAYNAVMADWAIAQERQKNYPPQLQEPYSSFANDAKTKYNAIQKPAYATYVSTLSSINAQGCNVVKVYSDTSWAGY